MTTKHHAAVRPATAQRVVIARSAATKQSTPQRGRRRPSTRHCEERSDEAIHAAARPATAQRGDSSACAGGATWYLLAQWRFLEDQMAPNPDEAAPFFPGFRSHSVDCQGVSIHAVVGGARPAASPSPRRPAVAHHVARNRPCSGRALHNCRLGFARIWIIRKAAWRDRSLGLFEAYDGGGSGRAHAQARVR